MSDTTAQPGLDSLSKSFEPAALEAHWGPEWERRGYGAAGFRGTGAPQAGEPAFSIQLPPPNVTGTLHMGHAFNQTIMDSLTRYHRMRGFNTVWVPGTDHAGIATQIVVERQLQEQGISRYDMGPTPPEARKNFVSKVWEWKEKSGNTITTQMRRMGDSVDWSREYFTMDPKLSQTVTETFVQLYEQGLIYRGKRLVNWDPVLQSAVSDLEVENEERNSFMWHILYPFSDGPQTAADGTPLAGMHIATTRPETMLADGALCVHPDDERYQHLIGKLVDLPLCDRKIPIIADDFVDKEFGSGCVKITGAHDFNDYACSQRHGLPLITIFTLDAKINGNGPAAYRGLDRYDCRKAVLKDLEAQGFLEKSVPHKNMVPVCARTGQVVEPMLTDQWFVAMSKVSDQDPTGKSIAQKAIDAVASGQVSFVPENWVNTYNQWMNNIQDWCISRQLWWGHRIPAWFDDAGNCYVGSDEAEARAKAGLSADVALTQDSDVLETWFSSQLWPFSTMGWPDEQAMAERGFDRYLPSSVLVTGFDIIFFWVARMVMATDSFVGQVPFRDVYMTGLIRDKDGQKMSKSKGNVLDPLDIIDGISLEDLVAKRTGGLMQPKMAEKIEKATRKEFPDGIVAHGADALRFTIAALATHGRDIKFDMGRAEGYKNFCNKLWNATRFVLMNTEGFADAGAPQPKTDAERWILSRLAKVAAEAEAQFAAYRFDLLSQALYEFAWNDFCDWFVELAKPALSKAEGPALNGSDKDAADSTRHTLLYVLESLLRLLHPLTPFVTEELWQQVAPKLGIDGGTVSLRPYPVASDFADQDYAQADADVEWLKTMVSALRRVRSELNVSPAKTIRLLLQDGNDHDRTRVVRFASSLSFLLKLDDIAWLEAGADAPASAAAVVGELKLLVPLEGLVDLDAERARLDKEIARVSGEKDKSEAKLAKFTDKVPPAVVEQERQRLADWSSQLAALHAQRAKL